MRFDDEPVRGSYGDDRLVALPGAERAPIILHSGHRPPISFFLGISLHELAPGSATCSMPVTRWLRSPQGRVPLGALAPVADVGFGLSVLHHLPPGVLFTTAELSLQRLAPPSPEGSVVAHGRCLHFGPNMAYSEVELRDEVGTLVAHGTSRIHILRPIDSLPDPPDQPAEPYVYPDWPTPDPFEREPAGAVLDPSVWKERSGLDILRAQSSGELPQPPVAELFDVHVVDADDGHSVVEMTMSDWLSSPARTVQGGVTAFLADASVQTAVQTGVVAGDRFAPLDLKVNYLRPVFPTDTITATAAVRHRGRSIAIAEADLVNQEGKPVAIATGSAQLGADELL